jgi:hypothetical protein
MAYGMADRALCAALALALAMFCNCAYSDPLSPPSNEANQVSGRTPTPIGRAAGNAETGTSPSKKAGEAQAPVRERSANLLDFFKQWSDYFFGGVLGGALGFAAKWLLEQLSARAAARREFAKEVTKQISSLAEKHYWGLANAAGVLAGQLEGYLVDRTVHLALIWESREALRARLNELAGEAGRASFPHFCRLIWLFDAFQFQGSTTYLLTSHSAGDMCKRLYNVFIGSLPVSSSLNIANIREITAGIEDGGKVVRKKLRDLPAGTLTDMQISQQLPAEQKAYIEWFESAVPDVSTAANALRAFNELLNHELALLYRLWFRQRPSFPEAYVLEQRLGQWPDLLTRQAVDTLSLAGYQSNLLRPLGSATTGTVGTEVDISQPQAPKRRNRRKEVNALP